MTPAVLVIDVQKVYTDPASPLHCVGNADTIANINAITSAGAIRANARSPKASTARRPVKVGRPSLRRFSG